ncbi:MAG: Indole-3-glycerol phosphate synthase [Chlamydiae bacterium]|nr:Indole-3-glycerol phosphate synthase [Chlamydiota bacterium]
MKTTNYLDEIIKRKKEEVKQLVELTKSNPNHVLNKILDQNRAPSTKFARALRGSTLAVIGEIKRSSPSAGVIQEIADPVELALEYCRGGVSTISVLTDKEGFGGSLDDLCQISLELGKEYSHIPILRKDFILHPLQLAEAVYAGASAVLLIVGVLGNDLKTFVDEATQLGLETLTEVHSLEELELALKANCPIIGVNHRNLKNFTIDLTLSETLAPIIPAYVISVAESGIQEPSQARKMDALGYDAVLVGQALVRSKNPSLLIAQMKGEPNES